jgi:hypothetical protein
LLAAAQGCGGATGHGSAAIRPEAVAPTPAGPAFGLTEDNAALLWDPTTGPRTPDAPGAQQAFTQARWALSALRPRFVRLLIDWAALQPDPARPPALEAPRSGCARAAGPCAPYAGVREEFAAIASEQRAAHARAAAGPQVVIDIFGTPAWAARPVAGCHSGASAFSHPLSATGIAGYRALIRSLLSLGAREGVQLQWWSAWNEPNYEQFLSPQRVSCLPGASPPISPTAYGELARAMAAELRADGPTHHMLLGELSSVRADSPGGTTPAHFVASLPPDVVCLSDTWSLHAYASRGAWAQRADPVTALEAALDARGGCAAGARVWVTEAGAGAPRPGASRPPGTADEVAGCEALAAQLLRWYRDPRVGAIFQYTFREDPSFPVGLLGPELTHVYPTYRLWLAWALARGAGQPPAADAPCGP